MKNRSHYIGIAMLIFTTIAWGGMFPVSKAALFAMDGFYLTFVRYGIASIIFLGLLYLVEGRRAFSFEGKGLKLFFLGSLGFAGFSNLVFVSLAYSKAEHAAVIMAMMPLITAVVAWAIKGVRPSFVTFVCVGVALLGVLMVITKGEFSAFSGGSFVADMCIFLGAVFWVLYTMGAASFSGWSPLRYTALTSGLGAFSIVIVTFSATILGYAHAPSLATLWSVKLELGYLIVIAAVMAVFAWNAGIKTVGPLNGVLFINLVPVTTFSIGLMQGRNFTSIELAGASLTILALLTNNIAARGWFLPRRQLPVE